MLTLSAASTASALRRAPARSRIAEPWQQRSSDSILEICFDGRAAAPGAKPESTFAAPVNALLFAGKVADHIRARLFRASGKPPRRKPRKTVRFAADVAVVIAVARCPPALVDACFYGADDFAAAAKREIVRRKQLGIASMGCITSSEDAWAEPAPGTPRPRLVRSASSLSALARTPSLKGGQFWSDHFEDDDDLPLE